MSIIENRLLPYFKNKKMCDIAATDIIKWQNEMLAYRDSNGKAFSATYLKTMHNQISAIMNHAVRFYELKSNPAAKAGSVGKKEATEMLFWTKDEYLKFADSMMDKPLSFYAFEVLYWCGLRVGELLALTAKDFDFKKNTLSITKSYQRLKGKDVITDPKTPKSKRIISIPDFLSEEMQEYIKMFYSQSSTERLFPMSKSYLHHEMTRGSTAQGIKRIRIHDLRHSHVSLLIEMGFSAVAIADRVGHESIDITYRYAHLFPSKQSEMASKLNIERGVF
jgi:integrase